MSDIYELRLLLFIEIEVSFNVSLKIEAYIYEGESIRKY